MRFGSIIECYKSIREDASGRQRGKTLDDSAEEELRDLILSTDESHADETIVNFGKPFKAAFCVIFWIMHRSWKQRVNDVRRSTTRGDNDAVSYHKITRESCIPAYILNCRSNIAKAAVVTFCMQTSKCELRKRALLSVLNGNCESMESAIALASSTNGKNQREPETHALKILVRTFVDLSDLVRDRGLNKFAMYLNEGIYLDTIVAMANSVSVTDTITNLISYDALIVKYLRECVAPKFYAKENEQIINQFKTDPRGIVRHMIDNLPKKPIKLAVVNTPVKEQPFDPERIYEVFIGKQNYTHGIVLTNINHEGRCYHILTYNDCLYDVRGSTQTKILANGEEQHEYLLYNRLSWSDRLTLLPYRAKIILSRMSGQQLNDYADAATLTVSWIDESGYECSKTHIVRARSTRNEAQKRRLSNDNHEFAKKHRSNDVNSANNNDESVNV